MRHLLFILSAFCSTIAVAQPRYYLPDNSIKVFEGSTEHTLAWCGGFNTPQFAMADLNRDGRNDLVVYESYIGIKTFINQGTAGAPDYRFAPEYALNFPPVSYYLNLTDYNCDNIPDLFHGGSTGFQAHRGYYNSANQLCFTYYKNLFYTNDVASGGAVNAYNNPGDIPAIVDVDNDGDVDFASYNIIGGTINYYRNMRVENGLPCDSIRIHLRDRCWGKVYQGFYRTHTLGYSCSNAGLMRGTADTAGKPTHSGNTPCLFDWDMDGDYDYLDGSVSFDEMTFLKNGKTEYGGPDSMISQDTMWQTGGTTVRIPTWPAAFNIDIDQDGKKDLLIAPNAGNTSNYKNIWFYKNLSTAGTPNWQYRGDTFLQDKSIDLGSAAYPMLYDYNKDGKLDLFIGSDGYRQPGGLLRSRMSYYQNISTTGSPAFNLLSRNFINMDTFGFAGAAPAFGDIDGDGLDDMLVGHTDGTITYYKNAAATATMQPVWQPAMVQLTDNAGTVIDVNGRAAPFIYDIDRDGKKDLVIGSMFGTLHYYRNTSTTAGTISLTLINDRLGQAKADPDQIIGCFSTPYIGRLDSTARDYLLLGSNSGNLYQYDSIFTGDTTLTYPLLNGQYSYTDTTHLQYNHPGTEVGVYSNHRSAPTVGDIDGDGDYEMIIGDVRGGVRLYKRKIYVEAVITTPIESGAVNIFPNPASNELHITWQGMIQPTLQVAVLNIQGQILYTADAPTATQQMNIPLTQLPPGLYICLLQSGSNRYYNKFTVLR